MTIKAGDKIPSVTLNVMTKDGPGGISTDEIFKGKKVAVPEYQQSPDDFTDRCTVEARNPPQLGRRFIRHRYSHFRRHPFSPCPPGAARSPG